MIYDKFDTFLMRLDFSEIILVNFQPEMLETLGLKMITKQSKEDVFRE